MSLSLTDFLQAHGEKRKKGPIQEMPKTHTQTTKHTHTRDSASSFLYFFYYDNLGSDILTTSPVLGAQYDTVK